MKKFTNYTRGFTLIELLVVVAIIGVLASVILVALNSARYKSKDARIISDVLQIRTQMESDVSGGNYANSISQCTFTDGGGTQNGFCVGNTNSLSIIQALLSDAWNNHPTSDASITNGSSTWVIGNTSNSYVNRIPNTAPGGNYSEISIIMDSATTPKSYSIWAKLSTGNYFCVDSSGFTKNPATVLPSAVVLNTANPPTPACQ